MNEHDFQLLRFADQPIVPWKNGGGMTREVAVAKHAEGAGFRWRVSAAEVASDSAFSLFPGVDRKLWLMRGEGMILDIDGVEHRLAQRLDRIEFPGEARVAARLIRGPILDLNVMVERSTTSCEARVDTISSNQTRLLHGPAAAASRKIKRIVLVLSNRLRCKWGEQTLELAVGDALHWTEVADAAVSLTAEGEGVELLQASFAELPSG